MATPRNRVTELNETPKWIAVDWGATHLRAWLMSAQSEVLERRDSDKGTDRLTRDQFVPTLRALVQDSLPDTPLPTVICGAVGSHQGWADFPYLAVPCAPPNLSAATRLSAPSMDIHILPGVKQSAPTDVMHGTETQIAGFLSATPDFDGILCLPGAHTRWVHISAGEIVSFRTFMTGELFDLISTQSALRLTLGSEDWDQDAFDAGLSDTMSRPADLAAKLFSLHAEGLLEGLSAGTARARLSALLIGAELAATKPYWLGQQVVVLGDGELTKAYQTALAAQGAMVTSASAENMTLAGLIAAYQGVKDVQT